MLCYGAADWLEDEVVELFPSRDSAEAALAEIEVDEPGFEAILAVARFDFAPESADVDLVAGGAR
jgi:hypothetical protein